ncbi:MAG: hypothetical protein IMZ58_00235 [Thermoplasmata archaeon]|nr:hypothetical protein [Thermoplasmata archaeon]
MKRTSKIIAVLAVLIAGSMIASGALLTYLSGTVTTTTTVSSPMEQSISGDNSGYVIDGTIDFPGVHGGETVTFYVKTINKANAPITGNGKNIVTNYDGLTGADFSLVQARTWSSTTGSWTEWYTLTATPINSYTISFAYGPIPSITWEAGQTDVNQIAVTFEEAAFGTYTFTSQIVPT